MQELFWLVGFLAANGQHRVQTLEKEAALKLLLLLLLWFELSPDTFSVFPSHSALLTFPMGHGLATAFFLILHPVRMVSGAPVL